MDEVRYVRGDPEFVVKTYVTRGLTAEEFLNAVQVDDLKHDNDMKTYLTWGFPEKQQPWIVVSFDRRTKTLRNIWCFTGIDNIGNSNACPPLDGVRVGTSEEALVERLGEPSNQSIYGGDKTIDSQSAPEPRACRRYLVSGSSTAFLFKAVNASDLLVPASRLLLDPWTRAGLPSIRLDQ